MTELRQNIILYKNRHHKIRFRIDGVKTLEGCKIYWAASEKSGGKPFFIKNNSNPSEIEVVDDIFVVVKINKHDFDGVDAIASIIPEEIGGPIPKYYHHELLIVDLENKPFQAAVGSLDLRKVIINI